MYEVVQLDIQPDSKIARGYGIGELVIATGNNGDRLYDIAEALTAHSPFRWRFYIVRKVQTSANPS